MKILQKIILSLIVMFLCLRVAANNCDSTFQLFKTIKAIGIDRHAKYPEDLKKLNKECIFQILDSINNDNYEQIIQIITMYYVYIEPNVYKNVLVNKIDSAIIAKISYGLSNNNLKVAEKCLRCLEITKQISWILERDSLAKKALQRYILNRNGNVDREILSYVSAIGDTVSFWLIYKNIKEERKNDGNALRFLIHCGIEYFGYYSLFIENAEYLIELDNSSMVIRRIIDVLPQKYNFNDAKKIFSKLTLNERLMRKYSLCDGKNMTMSVFNYDFYWGIPIFYPNIAKSNEYINNCFKEYLEKGYATEKSCVFDKRLYNLVVKTIKAEYKDLK
jgi:hypothetical protein